MSDKFITWSPRNRGKVSHGDDLTMGYVQVDMIVEAGINQMGTYRITVLSPDEKLWGRVDYDATSSDIDPAHDEALMKAWEILGEEWPDIEGPVKIE